ncbi:MAG: Mth938-like domain-containing protein [Pseudomonadota bacterium]
MKLHPDKPGNQHVVTAYEAGRVAVNGRVLTRSLLLLPEHLDEGWGPDAFDALATEHLAQLAAFSCDVLLLGTGLRQRFPTPALLRPLIESGLGFEIMDTAAACRTYNLLVGEGRIVLAGLIIEGHTP